MYGYIYLTVDTLKNHVYVGQHKSPKYEARYMGSGKIIKNIIKSRKETLKNYVIEWCSTKEELDIAEISWIKNFREECGDRCLNIANGGEGGNHQAWNKGKKLGHYDEERVRKMSESHKGQSAWNKGMHHTEETRKKISNALTGRKLSKELREKLSESCKRYWMNKNKKETNENIDRPRTWS